MTRTTAAQAGRRQLSLLVPDAQSAAVERVRLRLDPVQHALIPAHVTLCRDDEVPHARELALRLEQLQPFRLTMHFGEPEELADGCILLRPRSGTEEFQALRRAIVGASARDHGAHLTLLHPLNATGVRHDLAAIGRELAGLVIAFGTISLIEQHGGKPWRVTATYGPDTR